MRDGSAQLAQVLTQGSFSMRLVADVFYGDERTIVNLPVDPDSWTLTWDVEGQTKFSGTIRVIYQGLTGDGVTPEGLTDPLSPFGQEISLLAKISFGSVFTETVLLGRFRIDSVPNASDSWFGFGGVAYVSGSIVDLEIVDLLDNIRRWGFRWPGVPTYTTSTWDELALISGLPIDTDPLPDKATPGNLVYQATSGARLDAVQQLMSYLGGVPVVNSFGELTALPFNVGAPVNTLTMGLQGTVVSIENALDSSQVFNEVVGSYQDDDGNPIWAVATITGGPLTYGGLYPATTAYDSDDTVTTQDAAFTRVRNVLQQYLQAYTIRYTLTTIVDPRAEIGDFVQVNGPQAVNPIGGALSAPLFTLTGRLVSIELTGTDPGLMTVVIDVGAALEATISVGT